MTMVPCWKTLAALPYPDRPSKSMVQFFSQMCQRDLNAEDAEVFAEGLFPGRVEPMIARVVTVSRPGNKAHKIASMFPGNGNKDVIPAVR